jgi:hypothetical protein
VTSTAPFYQWGDRYRATVRDLAAPLALLIVVLAPVVVIGAITSVRQWAGWMVRTGGALGILGLVLTAVATINLAVPRTCSTGPVDQVNRPVLSLAVDDGDCFRAALAQLGLAGLVGVAASAVVLGATRSGRGDGGAAPAVPSR